MRSPWAKPGWDASPDDALRNNAEASATRTRVTVTAAHGAGRHGAMTPAMSPGSRNDTICRRPSGRSRRRHAQPLRMTVGGG